MNGLIFPPIEPKLRIAVIGNSAGELANYLGLTTCSFEDSDCAIFIVDAVDGISKEDQEKWSIARDLYIPSLIAITNITSSEIDFEDMSAIAAKLLDPVVTPYLVLHADDGSPTALIDLDTLQLIDYSNDHREIKDSDPEHKVLVFEFRKEYLEAIEEFGADSFELGLSFPAIPIVESINLGKYELLQFVSKLPSRS